MLSEESAMTLNRVRFGDYISLVKEKCDFTTTIPMKGDIDSLNASVAAGVLAYEIVRQRLS